MITDLVVAGVADFLKAAGREELSTVSFFERDFGGDLTYPACIISEDGSPTEDDIIRGQWTVPISVTLMTIPEGDESAQGHRLIASTIADLIGDDEAMIEHLSQSMQCNDSLGGQGSTQAEDGYRITTFTVEVKAADLS